MAIYSRIATDLITDWVMSDGHVQIQVEFSIKPFWVQLDEDVLHLNRT